MQRREATSIGTEVAYYASLEVIHSGGRPADLAKTLRFKKPTVPPPIPRRKPAGTPPPIQPDPVTTKFERCEDQTTPFLKESAPYELIDIQDGEQEKEPVDAVEMVDIDLASLELIAASDLLAGDTIRSAGPIFVEQPGRANRGMMMWIALVLVAAFSIGIALAYLAMK